MTASLLLVGAGCWSATAKITTFEECVAAGNPVMESYPRQCRAEGKTFVEVIAPASTIVQFGEAVTLQMNQTRAVQGGLQVTLIGIADSRCKPDVQCIWAGELSPKLRLDLPNGTSEELTLGTMRATTADAAGYHFELKDATETSATVVISK
jgi:hypothetical protein